MHAILPSFPAMLASVRQMMLLNHILKEAIDCLLCRRAPSCSIQKLGFGMVIHRSETTVKMNFTRVTPDSQSIAIDGYKHFRRRIEIDVVIRLYVVRVAGRLRLYSRRVPSNHPLSIHSS